MTTPAPVEIGAEVRTDAGRRYQLVRPLASGGMADIHLARAFGAGDFEKLVVLKTMLPTMERQEHSVDMFLDEARLAAQLHHHNVVQVFDFGRFQGRYFLAMEYLDGVDLRDVLKVRGALPLQVALPIASEIAAGLAHAHRAVDASGKALEIVHRDVSPSNVMLTFDGAVKLVDFGIARATQQIHDSATGSLKGKLQYLSPEQATGELVDRRSDLFSFGIVLYEMTTGLRPFGGPKPLSAISQIVSGQYVRPSRVAPYPPALEAIVERLLEREPSRRYQRAEDVRRDLNRVAEELHISMSTYALAEYMATVRKDRMGSDVARPGPESIAEGSAPDELLFEARRHTLVDALARPREVTTGGPPRPPAAFEQPATHARPAPAPGRPRSRVVLMSAVLAFAIAAVAGSLWRRSHRPQADEAAVVVDDVPAVEAPLAPASVAAPKNEPVSHVPANPPPVEDKSAGATDDVAVAGKAAVEVIEPVLEVDPDRAAAGEHVSPPNDKARRSGTRRNLRRSSGAKAGPPADPAAPTREPEKNKEGWSPAAPLPPSMSRPSR